MHFIGRITKVFAVLSLLFVSSYSLYAQGGSVYRLPAGTKILLSMDAGISSRISAVNDTFTTRVARPITIEDVVVLPFGTVIEGRVTQVASAGYRRKNGRMDLRFETIRFAADRKRLIDGLLVDVLRPDKSNVESFLSIIGGTAAGALIGAASGKDNGALAGAGIGAGAGTAVAILKKGKDVFLRTDEEFEIVLKSEVTLPASDY